MLWKLHKDLNKTPLVEPLFNKDVGLQKLCVQFTGVQIFSFRLTHKTSKILLNMYDRVRC